ncbi:hypothetical protein GKZ89_14650 [Bacillus mangrovi]|uniref:Uncharacterized protein n=1 Tax=Metabacillus mangrovi TaxID=1491830 RepID=A0A7X2S7J1_9BACI|nr:hypothetical protein [Metabacillus mangrovi]MTH54641.1 hypothetical protein [Metabacillus mangrovi]
MANISFKSIYVNVIQNSSGVFYGENLQLKWKNRTKLQEGFGKISGNGNLISNNLTASEIARIKAKKSQLS